MIYNREVLKFNLCDYNDAWISVKGDFTATPAPPRHVSFKNCAPFTKCIPKFDVDKIDDAWIFRFTHNNVQFKRR